MNKNAAKQDNLRFDGVKFYSVRFEVVGPPKEEVDINLDINPKVHFDNEENRKFDIIYDVELKVEDVFFLNLKAVGYFQIGEDIMDNPNIKEQLINTNAPAIVFPYVRSFISMFTSNLGTIPTLTLPTHFFKGKLEKYEPQ